MAKSKVWEFEVKGSGPFPTDMLRYDACYPKDTESANRIDIGHGDIRQMYREPRTVKLCSTVKAPTQARWETFGWFVNNVSERSW